MTEPDHLPCPLRMLAHRQPAGIFLSTPSGAVTFEEADRRVQEFEKVLSNSRARFCIPGTESNVHTILQLFACLRKGIPIVLQNQRLPSSALKEQSDWVASCLESLTSFPATILFTSGSSGRSKAVVHSLNAHWSSAVAANHQAPLIEGDRWLCQLPLYHVGGLAIVFRCLEAGATVCFPSAGMTLSEAIREGHSTHLSLVPTQLYRWIKDPDFCVEGIKRVLIGGAALPDSLRRKAEELGIPIATSYGMTETASQVSATPPGETAAGSGRPLDHVQVQISDEGEIRVKGGSLATGYLTEKGITSLTDPEGWLHTRDRGRLEDGILHVDGRFDLQFISGGENIQPERIEQALLGLEDLSEAIVVPKADPEFGHRPVAWVDAEISEEAVTKWNQQLREVLPGYMIPIEYRTLPQADGLKRRWQELKP